MIRWDAGNDRVSYWPIVIVVGLGLAIILGAMLVGWLT
jgi:hypothetical protein